MIKTPFGFNYLPRKRRNARQIERRVRKRVRARQVERERKERKRVKRKQARSIARGVLS